MPPRTTKRPRRQHAIEVLTIGGVIVVASVVIRPDTTPAADEPVEPATAPMPDPALAPAAGPFPSIDFLLEPLDLTEEQIGIVHDFLFERERLGIGQDHAIPRNPFLDLGEETADDAPLDADRAPDRDESVVPAGD